MPPAVQAEQADWVEALLSEHPERREQGGAAVRLPARTGLLFPRHGPAGADRAPAGSARDRAGPERALAAAGGARSVRLQSDRDRVDGRHAGAGRRIAARRRRASGNPRARSGSIRPAACRRCHRRRPPFWRNSSCWFRMLRETGLSAGSDRPAGSAPTSCGTRVGRARRRRCNRRRTKACGSAGRIRSPICCESCSEAHPRRRPPPSRTNPHCRGPTRLPCGHCGSRSSGSTRWSGSRAS